MPNKRRHKMPTVMVCTDCMHVIEGMEPELTGERAIEIESGLNRAVEGYDNILSDWDSNTGDGIDEFSWTPCETCGSRLGGSRYRYALYKGRKLRRSAVGASSVRPMRNPRGGSKAGRSWDAKVGRRRGHRGGFTTPFRIEKWEERDRLHIALEDANGRTIIEWWDDEAREAIEDGFLKPRDLLGSATEYAEHMGLL